MTIKITKFEWKELEDRKGYLVGFEYSSNGRVGYKEYLVNEVHCKDKTDKEIVDFAYQELSEFITFKISEFDSISPLLGTEYVPNQ